VSEKTLPEAIDDFRAAILPIRVLIERTLTPILDWMTRILESR
jgi:hypothetical protein